MSVSADWSEVRALAADLSKAGPATARKAQQAVAKSAHDIQAQAKPPVKTGALKASIGVDITDGGFAAEIGPTVHYGAYVEFGTRRMAPQPYMGPAFDAVAPGFEEAITQIGGEIL